MGVMPSAFRRRLPSQPLGLAGARLDWAGAGMGWAGMGWAGLA